MKKHSSLIEVNISATFDELDSDDSIVDIAVGSVPKSQKNLLCAVTEKGEALVIGADLVELLLHDCKH